MRSLIKGKLCVKWLFRRGAIEAYEIARKKTTQALTEGSSSIIVTKEPYKEKAQAV